MQLGSPVAENAPPHRERGRCTQPEELARIAERICAGETIKAIAVTYGVSREYISQIVYTRLPPHARPRRPKGRTMADAASPVPAPPSIILPERPVGPLLLRFAEGYEGQQGRIAHRNLKNHHCRFPIDRPDGALRFCGQQKESGSSYCPQHRARCEAPPRRKGVER